MTRTLIAGNWKMNGTRASLSEVSKMAQGLDTYADEADCLICPPASLLMAVSEAARATRLKTGGQDCHPEASGAHTGDIAAGMLADAGADYVIVGHSERRTDHAESDEIVAAKAAAGLAAGLIPIICVGETLAQREAGQTLEIVSRQLTASLARCGQGETIVLAYEPVWAIGTGLTPSMTQIGEVHDAMRQQLAARYGAAGQQIALLYGGSMKPENAADILAIENVNGGLIGGASLKADDFLAIYRAAV